MQQQTVRWCSKVVPREGFPPFVLGDERGFFGLQRLMHGDGCREEGMIMDDVDVAVVVDVCVKSACSVLNPLQVVQKG